MRLISIDFIGVKFAHSAGIEVQIYISFAQTHLCGQVCKFNHFSNQLAI